MGQYRNAVAGLLAQLHDALPSTAEECSARLELVSWLWMYVCGCLVSPKYYGLPEGSSATKILLHCYAGFQDQDRSYFCPSGCPSTQPAQRAPLLIWLAPFLCRSSPPPADDMGQLRLVCLPKERCAA